MAAALRGRAIRILALSAAAFSFAGCAQNEGRYPSFCPQVAVLDVPSQLTRFREGSGRSRPDLLFQATIKHVDTMCEVGKDKADVQLTLEIHAERGPANTRGIAEFNYFVAVLGPDKEILTRENFTSVVQFQGTDTEVTFPDQFVATVPLEDGQAASAYRVYLGFEMTPEELAYNRQRKGIRQ